MTRRKRRTRVVYKPPTVTKEGCPFCGAYPLYISLREGKWHAFHIKRGEDIATYSCGNCGVYVEVKVEKLDSEVSLYNKLFDTAYGLRKILEQLVD